MLMNKESLTLYRTHDIEPFNLEDWDYDEDSVHPNFYKFKKERATWTTIASTNRGIDNCVGYFYWSPREKCICCENGFDELKNQWGLSGFTTQDINRCQTTARACALDPPWD